MKSFKAILSFTTLTLLIFGCSKGPAKVTEIKKYPVDGMDGIITRLNAKLDKTVTSDGNGSLKLMADGTTVFRLYETGDIDVENARLFYRANVRTENVKGSAYLEMWVQLDEAGEFFSRDLQSPLTGTNDWSSEETFFMLRKGQNPDNVKLNLVIEGGGIVWIDDIRLAKGKL